MLVSDFDYNLPEENIAKHPPKTRGTTRLLVLDRAKNQLIDSNYAKLPDFLKAGDLLVLNDTRVMPARLFTKLPDGRPRGLTVLEKHQSALNTVMYRGKLHVGDQLTVLKNHSKATSDKIIIKELLGNGTALITSSRPLTEIVKAHGSVPLPPYLRRTATPEDTARYQTVWARELGSAAAPTASLNMTADLLARLKQKGVKIVHLTLHVGLGTFLPIRSDEVEKHHMHSEYFHIPKETLAAIHAAKASKHRVVAVGTTVARTLEFWAKTGQTEGEDDIFIYPGFKFKAVDALLTNFHAPKSTVLMLAAAFAGWDKLKPAYAHAIQTGYQLLSYGDSMFIC